MRRALLPALTCLLLAALGGTAAARPGQPVMFEVPGNANQLPTLVPKLESLGVGAIRVNLRWYDAAPDHDSRVRPKVDLTDPANYDWSSQQPLIDAAKAKGWKVTVSLAGPAPRWATEGARDHITRPRTADYEDFAEAAGRQLGTKVTYWSIWNEPNFRTFLMPQFVKGKPASPAIYRGLYLAAQKGLKKTVSSPRILFGETAPRAGGDGVAPLQFIRDALCLDSKYKKTKAKCAKVSAYGYAHHPYAPPSGPYFVPTKKDDVTIGVLSRLTSALDKAGKAKAITSKLKVYLTEFGVQSYPDKIAGVPLATQSDQRSLAERIAWGNSRVYGFSQYLMQDDKTGTTSKTRYSGFQSGLETVDGKEKPAYDGFRLPLSVERSKSGKAVSLWGLVRPAKGATTVTVQYAAKGKAWKTLKTVKTHSDGHWTLNGRYASNRVWRVQWTSPDGETFTGSTTKAYKRP
jgi:hypothetical protein